MAIELYPHNQETYEKMMEMFKTSNRVGAVQPTGTGKSFLMLKWIEDHPDDQFIVISPSLEIFMQLIGYAKETNDEDLLKSVRMISYQTLIRMCEEEIANQHAQKIIVDEFHRAGAGLWGPALLKLLDANPDAKVFGTSATPVRYLDNGRDMAYELFDRNLAVEMTLGDAINRKILPTPIYLSVWYDFDGRLIQFERDISYIKGSKERNEKINQFRKMRQQLEDSFGAHKIFREHMPKNGKFIVFCRDREHLDEMTRKMHAWLSGVNLNLHWYVSVSAQEDKDLQLQAFKDDQDIHAVKLLYTIDRFNEGLHVKGIDGVIMLRPTVSPIIYFQQLGRALASNGKIPIIFDMVNNYGNIKAVFEDKDELKKGTSSGNSGSNEKVVTFNISAQAEEIATIINRIDELTSFSYNKRWNDYFDLYCQFKAEFGDEPLHKTIYKGLALGNWCNWQRSEFNRGNLSDERYERLLSVGFVFDVVSYNWLNKLSLYISYKKEFGEEPIKNTVYQDEDLGSWCSNQRVKFREGKLTEDRINMLLDAGFCFDAVALKREKEQQEWLSTLDLYIEYCNKFNMPPIANTVYKGVSLGIWCNWQRSEFNRGNLSDERYQMLTNAGFIFKTNDTLWENGFNFYVAFKEEFGREPDSDTIYKSYKLGSWCESQRKKFREGKLSATRVKLLLDAGFVFHLRKYKEDLAWSSMLDLYVSYKKVFGCEPANSTIYKGKKLGGWCKLQRLNFHAGTLPYDRLEKLNEVGFSFEHRKKGLPKQADKLHLSVQIQSASTRAAESHSSSKVLEKESSPER